MKVWYGSPRLIANSCAVSKSAIGIRIVTDLVAPRTTGSLLILPSLFALRNSSVITFGCVSHHSASSRSDLNLGILVIAAILPLLGRYLADRRSLGRRSRIDLAVSLGDNECQQPATVGQTQTQPASF